MRDAAGEGEPAVQASNRERFRSEMRDDLNAPQALAVAWEVARGGEELSPADRRVLLLEFDRFLGIDLVKASPAEVAFESAPRIDALLEQSDEARADKDWATADRIRDELTAEGIEIVDTPSGAHWRRK